MSAIKKLIVFVLVIAVVIALERAWLNAIQPDVSKQFALAQVNADEADLRDLRLFEGYKEGANIVVVFLILCAAWLLAARPGFGAGKSRSTILLALTLVPFAFGGCIRAFDRPEYTAIAGQSPNLLLQMQTRPR